MLKINNLAYTYSAGPGFSFPDFDLASSETLLVHGKSGVGKSTLLNLLALFESPNAGSIQIANTEVSSLSSSDKTRFRAKNIGMVFQKNYFIKSLSVLDNLLIARHLAHNKPQKSVALQLLEELNIAHLSKKNISQLSGGEQQRLSIIRAIINEPKLVLADEPSSALDDLNTVKVYEMLERQCKNLGASLLIVSHDQRLKNLISRNIELS
jgi:ABC-type lipoprotein export system ATPase subunit